MAIATKTVGQMEFSVGKADLVKELGLCQGVVEKKTTIPILSNVLLEAHGDRIEFTATDLEIGVRGSCPANVVGEGSATVPAKKLLDYVRLLDEGDVAIRLQENYWLQIRAKRALTRMVGMSRESFPVLPQFPSLLTQVPAGLLLDMIRKTVFAISSEESRYTLNGSLLLVRADALTMVATDGHRLAMVENPYSTGVSSEVRVLVPKKALSEVERLLAEVAPDTKVDFGRDESHLFFRVDTRMLIARMLTGQFPNYEAVLPRENNRSVVLDRERLTAALRRVAQFADERSRAVRVQLGPDEVKLSSSSSDTGESEESLETEYSSEPLQIGFNAQYLLDFLAAADSGPVRFEFKDEQSAGQLRPVGEDGSQYRYVVMPMRI